VSGYRFSPSLQLAMITACTGIAAQSWSSPAERAWAGAARAARRQSAGVALPADDTDTYHTRARSKIHSLANLAAARPTCRLAAAALWGCKDTDGPALKSADLSCL
jgi:hypothetical protein